jgi:hypothetical protein
MLQRQAFWLIIVVGSCICHNKCHCFRQFRCFAAIDGKGSAVSVVCPAVLFVQGSAARFLFEGILNIVGNSMGRVVSNRYSTSLRFFRAAIRTSSYLVLNTVCSTMVSVSSAGLSR